MTASEIQLKILNETGLKTSVKKYSTGSMKGYIKIMPIFQSGSYPSMPFDFIQKLKKELAAFDYNNKPVFCSCSDICIYEIEDDRIQMKKEIKPKEADNSKTTKGWGSKNSQIRLNKAVRRYAKNLRKYGNRASYW
jgi:hypothetical protein